MQPWVQPALRGVITVIALASAAMAGARPSDTRPSDTRPSAKLHSDGLRSAELRSAELHSDELRSAELRSAGLRSAELRSAELRSAELRSAELRSAGLRSDELRSDELRSAGLPFYVLEDIAAEESARKAAAMEQALLRERQPTPNQLDWDAIDYDLDLTLDHTTQQLSGSVTARGRVEAASITQVELDLRDNMTAVSAAVGGSPTAFTHAGDLLTIDLDRAYVNGELFSVTVDYAGNPGGTNFGWATHGGEPMIWTLSQPYGGRDWWPSKDWPYDKADSVDVRVTVDENLVVASNGSLVSITPNGGSHTYHWHEGYPVATYLISLAIHPYYEYSLWYNHAPTDSMEIQYFVYPDHVESVEETYALVPRMLEVFADLFGEYPFIDEKYGHAEFEMGGGMEHQTCSSLGHWSEMLIAHELAHMWWGDHITCDTYHHIWLNEGFATYCEALYLEVEYGPEAMHEDMAYNAFRGAGTIFVDDPVGDPYRIFHGGLSYQKGSWVLHMLRHVIGDAAFFTTMQTYHTQYAYGTATTEQFRAVAESVSGRDLGSFFEQWIYGEYYPVYTYDWTAEDLGGSWQIELDIQQRQTHQIFDMPIDIGITLAGGGTEIQRVENSTAVAQYVLTVGEEPLAVELDPDDWILKRVFPPLENPTFDQGILLVNGISWDAHESELRSSCEQRAFWGDHDIDFWDLFDAPAGGYPSTLPPPLGHGAVAPAVMGRYSSVVWVSDFTDGDLDLWFASPHLPYLYGGGNLLLMTRRGQEFFTQPLLEYLGIEWWTQFTNLLGSVATYPGLVDMPRYGSQSYSATFYPEQLGPETTLLFIDPNFTPPFGIGAWRTTTRGGELAFLSGRPYRWNRPILHDNTDFILRHIFGEGSGTGMDVAALDPSGRLRLGACAPNPMNPSTRIPFQLPAAGPATIRIYDVTGRLVRELVNGVLEAGTQTVTWDGRYAGGRPAGSGVYYIRLASPAGEVSRTVTLLK